MSRKALIIANNTAKYGPLLAALSDKRTSVSACSYRDLSFLIDGENSSIICQNTGEDVKEFSRILVLSTSPYHLENYIFSALSCYCRKNQIEILDDSFSNTDGKLYSLWRFWEQGIPVAKTAFGPVDFLAQELAEFGGTGVLKSVQGTKGKDNYLVHSEEELRKIIAKNQEINFILQEFIENDGDYRIIVANFKPKLAIFRSSNGKDFRNNTSVGGEAKLIPIEEVNKNVLELAVASAKALDIKIAGADILPSKTGEYTVLEVNRTPQLVTGAFPEEKQRVIRELISEH